MRSWFATKSTVITLIVKTPDGSFEDKIQIQSDQFVHQLKAIIDEKFHCDPAQQKLIFHGEVLQDEQPLSSYNIMHNSTILLMPPHISNADAVSKSKHQRIFDKSNEFSSESEMAQNNERNPKYFDPILNKLASYHPSLPIAVMENAQPISELMTELTTKFAAENKKLMEEQQSLTAYYYYLSLASLSAATKTVASSVYERLPSKEEISSTVHNLVRILNTKEDKAGIDRLVSLGFGRRESVEAYLACDCDEALAALFMAQNRRETKGNDEAKCVDASVGYLCDEIDEEAATNSVVQQFAKWMRGIFDDDELYYRYLLLFMREKIALMSCLEDINGDEQFFIDIGIEHKIHRKKILRAIEIFVENKEKFEMWWNQTIGFKKYLHLFERSFGIWDSEELLLQIRNKHHILDIIGIKNKDDVDCIWKHIERLRQSHSLYSAQINTQLQQPYNPNVVPLNMNYSAPPIAHCDDDDDESQKEGIITQM